MPTLPAPVPAVKPLEYFEGGHNVREIAIDDGIRELAHSLAAQGFLQPVGAVDHSDHGEVLYGFRRIASYRWALSEKLSVPAGISVLLYPPSITVVQRRLVTATENLQREDLTDPQIYRLCKELMELNPGWTRKELAAHLNKAPSAATLYLSPDDLIEEGRQAFLRGAFGFSKAYAITKSPDQARALTLALRGSTRDDLERESRKQRNGGETPRVRTSRIKIPLANEAASGVVTVSGESIDLDDAEALLREALKAVRSAKEKNLDCKTAQSVWRDMAKA